MTYVRNVLIKIAMLPLALLFFVPAYLAFILHPDFKKFHYKMDY